MTIKKQRRPDSLGVSWSFQTSLVEHAPGLCSHRYDASAKLAEESHNAARTAPLAIIFCVSGGGVVGFIYLLSITFSIQDSMSLLDPNATFGGTAAVAQVLINNDDPHS